MKQSNFFTRNGTIFHPGMEGIKKSIMGKHAYILVNCDNDEIFNELMTCIVNKYPQAVGVITEPNAGAKRGKSNTTITIQIDELYAIKIKVVTEQEYQADKGTIDKEKFDAKYKCVYCGGNV